MFSTFKHPAVAAAFGLGLAAAAMAAAPAPAAASSVLDRVRAAGEVVCGIDQTPGFSRIDETGRPAGFDVDMCRAVAAAVLGDPEAIRTLRVNTRHKFEAVTAGEIDIAFGMTTWTFSRDTDLGVVFPVVTYYDGQGFMAWGDAGVATLTDLARVPICVQTGTTSEANLRDFLSPFPDALVVPVSSSEEKFTSFAERRCLAVTGDRSELAAQRSRRALDEGQWLLLPGAISREPLGAVIVAGDPQWFSVVRWALLVPMIAEARGLHSARLPPAPAEGAAAADLEMSRLVGGDPAFGASLGLDRAWARRVVATVGSYAEIFERNLAPLGIDRGENTLWRDGGLLYAPPLR
ncbi:amino acid ABC transporter substrate-binding protein [Caenispirillum bisanense]|uniref:amino acid ABC transporter substrate-binding protein n=1 Tax=Caenispirillum bisanense TaxID=414052 RepID=UPI0031D75C32